MADAMRYFKRSQFLVLRYEDLMHMDGVSVLSLLSRFTGLHLSQEALRRSRGASHTSQTSHAVHCLPVPETLVHSAT